MKKSINKKFHNYFSSLLQRICLLLSQLLLIPTFISVLGVDLYGEWLILTTIPNYLLLSDFGLPLTVTNEICRLISLKEYKAQEKLYKSTVSFLVYIGLFLLVVFFIMSSVLDFSKIFNLKNISNHYATLIIGWFVFNVFFSLIFRVTIGYFRALNLFHKHEYFLALTLFLDFGVTLLTLKIQAPLYYIPMMMVIIRILVMIIINITLYKNNFYKFGFTTDCSRTIELIPVSLKLGFFQFGTALFIQGCTLLVGIILGSASVVVFNTIRTIVNSIRAFIGIIYIQTMPEFTILISNNHLNVALVKMKRLILLVSVISLISCLGLYFLRDIIFKLWIKKPFLYNDLFMVFMLVSIFFYNIWNAASMLPMSINKMNTLALYPILGAILLIIQYFTITKNGLVGLSFSFIIMDLIMLILVLKLNFKILKLNF
ncbi:hypothetical protein CJ739_1494 [Mariniflexile rhizosphaerae]|uniref:lipopolysaccharide biosynthesis protein n=1 Tax=unclassified Mariniflexile TaxID=2643887 RepID=UPI000CC793AF|nr:hypothetical protein [Mariniflexile sp. TRM1-10]AXP80583.1 hypothetical protein CJ739_1494 [Mariniflexile sp. TRM1-10]PLB20127.1 MAG: Polysaccharide biosynthesis protein [Flavobacteriaceae bacterium FS1-H7996/R]